MNGNAATSYFWGNPVARVVEVVRIAEYVDVDAGRSGDGDRLHDALVRAQPPGVDGTYARPVSPWDTRGGDKWRKHRIDSGDPPPLRRLGFGNGYDRPAADSPANVLQGGHHVACRR